MVTDLGGGGRTTDGSIAPFDLHPAAVGELDAVAGQLEGLANRGVDQRHATDQRFHPAEASWDGLAAAELRGAPVGMRIDAAQASDSMVWLAGSLRYWRTQVDQFNARVASIEGQRAEASSRQWGVPQLATSQAANGGPADSQDFESEIALARQAHERQMREQWWEAYQQFIDDGSRTAAAMLRDGPTAENLALLSDSGVWNNPSGAVELFGLRWQDQAMETLAGDMIELAEQVNDSDHQPSTADLERLEQVLTEYGDDEAFAYYFLNGLGAEGMLNLSGNLAFMVTDRQDLSELLWNEDRASTVGAIQAGLGVALATATTRRGSGGGDGYSPYSPGPYELDTDWFSAGRTQFEFGNAHRDMFPGSVRLYGYQLLGPLLNHGDYDTDFLALVGGDMIDFEMQSEDGSAVWTRDVPVAHGFEGMRLDWSNGWNRNDPAGFDPMIGLMNALERNPEGALEMFTDVKTFGDVPGYASPPPEGYRLDRLDYLLTDREWPVDDVQLPVNESFMGHREEVADRGLTTFGSVLEGAATLDDDRAVDLVESIVYELNADEQAMGYDNGEEVGDGQTRGSIDNDLMHPVLRESISNVMADHIWDVNRAVDQANSSMPGGRGAVFSDTHVLRLLADLGKSENAHETIREAEAVYATANYEFYLTGQADPHDDLSARIDAAEQVAGRYGSVQGALDYGAATQDWHEQLEIDNAHNSDAQNDFVVAGFVADQILDRAFVNLTAVDDLASFLVGDVLDAAREAAMNDNSGMVTYGVAETLSDSRQASADLAMASLYRSGALEGLPGELAPGGEPKPVSQWTEADYGAWQSYLDTTGEDTVVRLGNAAGQSYDDGVRRTNEILNEDVFNN